MIFKFNLNSFIYYLLSFFLFLPFVTFPDYIIGGGIKYAFIAYSLFIYLFIILYYIKKKKTNLQLFQVLVFIFLMIPMLSTRQYGMYQFLNQGRSILMIFSCSLLVQLGIELDKERFLKHLTIFWGILCTINYITFYLFFPSMSPTEMYYYFLGNDNGTVFETLCFFVPFFLYDIITKRKLSKKLLLFLIFSFVSYTYVKSGNGMAIAGILLLIYFIYNFKFIKTIIQGKYILIGSSLLYYLVVFQREGGILAFILNLFEKDATYSGRTHIWDRVFYYINMSPFLGYGYEENALIFYKLGNIKVHNIIAQIIYNGGYLTLLFFILCLFLVFFKMKDITFIPLKNLMLLILLAILIICVFDYYYSKVTIVLVLSLFYYIAKGGINYEAN